MNILFLNIKISKLHSYIHLNLVTSLPRPWRAFRVSRASARRVPRSPRRRHRCRARGRLEQAGARAHSNPSRRLVRARAGRERRPIQCTRRRPPERTRVPRFRTLALPPSVAQLCVPASSQAPELRGSRFSRSRVSSACYRRIEVSLERS